MNWFKRSHIKKSQRNNIALTLCGILYPIAKECADNELDEDEDYYYGKLFEAISKFTMDQNLDWNDELIGDIGQSIVYSNSEDFNELYNIINSSISV